MIEPNRKPTTSAPENESERKWNRLSHQFMFSGALETAMQRGDLDVGGLCDVLLESFGVVVKAADGPDALRVLCDACDSINLQPSAHSRLLDSLTGMTKEASAPTDAQGEGDPTPTLVYGSLTEISIDAIVTAGDSEWAVDMLWEAYNAAVFDERQRWFEEVMAAYRDAVYAVKDPADLVDSLFGALIGHERAPSTKWLPDARFVADACLEAVKAGGGPKAAVAAVLAAVDSIFLEDIDELAIIELLCRLYWSVVFGSNRSNAAVRQVLEVLERVAVATRDHTETSDILAEIADVLVENLNRAARAHNNPGRCAEIIYEILMNDAVSMDDPWWAVVPLADEVNSIVKHRPHRTKAIDVLFEALEEHRSSEPLVLLGLTHALMATSSGDWICRSG